MNTSRFSSKDAYKITHAFLDSEDSITINKRLFQFYSASTAIVLSDLFAKERRLSRMKKLREDGLFTIPASNRQSNTGLKIQTYKHHLDKLVEDGLVSAKREGLPSRIFYKINHEILAAMLMNGKRPNSQWHKIYATSEGKESKIENCSSSKLVPLTTPYIEEKKKEETQTSREKSYQNPDKERRVRAGTRESNLGDCKRKNNGRFPKWTKDEDWLSYFTKDFTTNQDFIDTWMEWIAYRKHTGKSLHRLPKAGPEQAKDLMKVLPSAATAALKESMKNGWTGIFPKAPDRPDGFGFAGKSNGRAVPKIDWKTIDIEDERFLQWKALAEERAFLMWKNLKGAAITPKIKAEIIYFAHRCMVFSRCEAIGAYRYHYGSGVKTIEIYEKFILGDDYYRTFTFTNFAGLKYGGKLWEAFIRYKSHTLGWNVMTGKIT